MQLELRQISKTFGPLKANQNITFTFEEGKTYAILGENGAGKSTLMKIIAGYQPPDPGGNILIDGKPVVIRSPEDALRHGIGMLYQDPLDFPTMTVLENYLTARPNSSFFPNYRAARTEFTGIAQRFGFALNPDVLIETMSVGARQQLEIVRLLSLNVKMLILDEPTTGISDDQRQQLFDTLRQLAREERLIIVIVTHKLADVQALCDEVLVLRHGRVAGTAKMPIPSEELVLMMFGQPNEAPPHQRLNPGTPVLTVQGLTINTRLLSLSDIDIEVREGEVLGLAGLDGSGQEEFMRACAGLDRASWQDYIMSVLVFGVLLLLFEQILNISNTVFIVTMLIITATCLLPPFAAILRQLTTKEEAVKFKGQPTRWLSYRDLRAQGLAYLSAGRLEEGLVTGLTLTQHFALAASRLPFVNWWQARQQTENAIKTYDVRGRPTSPIQTLSGGNQQRVALALLPENLALAFLENPTRGLDVNSARNIWSLLLERRSAGTAIVFSSPDMDEILKYSDRVLVFSSGKVTLVEQEEKRTTQTLGVLITGESL